MRKKLLSMLALFLIAVMGAKAQSGDASMLETPLTFEVKTAGTINSTYPQGQYTLNGGEKKAVPNKLTVQAGDILQYYGNGKSLDKAIRFNGSTSTAEVYVYGNVMSLIDEFGFSANTKLTHEQAFQDLFNRMKIFNHPDASKKLVLPATTLTEECYQRMFVGCASLTTAPSYLLQHWQKVVIDLCSVNALI